MRDAVPGRDLRPPAWRGSIPASVAAWAPLGVAVVWAARPALGGDARGQLAAAAVFLLVCAAVAQLMRRRYPHRQLGACNVVTLMRAALVCALLVPLAGGRAAGWGVAAVAAVALLLDGADGWLARRSGLASRFGARFDVEVDAALALVLSLHVLAGTAVGAEALALGLIRYAFVLAGVVWPWLAADLPPSDRRKRICVMQIAALIALQTPLLADAHAVPVARLAATAVIWSFAVDIRHLWRQRG